MRIAITQELEQRSSLAEAVGGFVEPARCYPSYYQGAATISEMDEAMTVTTTNHHHDNEAVHPQAVQASPVLVLQHHDDHKLRQKALALEESNV